MFNLQVEYEEGVKGVRYRTKTRISPVQIKCIVLLIGNPLGMVGEYTIRIYRGWELDGEPIHVQRVNITTNPTKMYCKSISFPREGAFNRWTRTVVKTLLLKLIDSSNECVSICTVQLASGWTFRQRNKRKAVDVEVIEVEDSSESSSESSDVEGLLDAFEMPPSPSHNTIDADNTNTNTLPTCKQCNRMALIDYPLCLVCEMTPKIEAYHKGVQDANIANNKRMKTIEEQAKEVIIRSLPTRKTAEDVEWSLLMKKTAEEAERILSTREAVEEDERILNSP